MSRLAKKPIAIPSGVTVTVNEGNQVIVKGAKSTLTRKFAPEVKIKVEGNLLHFDRVNNLKKSKALQGTTLRILENMLKGVSEGFEKNLEAVGVGYRFAAQGTGLQISLGYSHPIEYNPPEGIKLSLAGQTGVKVSGADKELVGAVAAEIRSFRGPEPYKGKGVKYQGEHIVRKAGKAGKAAGAA